VEQARPPRAGLRLCGCHSGWHHDDGPGPGRARAAAARVCGCQCASVGGRRGSGPLPFWCVGACTTSGRVGCQWRPGGGVGCVTVTVCAVCAVCVQRFRVWHGASLGPGHSPRVPQPSPGVGHADEDRIASAPSPGLRVAHRGMERGLSIPLSHSPRPHSPSSASTACNNPSLRRARPDSVVLVPCYCPLCRRSNRSVISAQQDTHFLSDEFPGIL
jgi:hypothetical protein